MDDRAAQLVRAELQRGLLLDGVLEGDIRVSADDGAEASIDADDIADVVVAALTDDQHAGQTYTLSGPRTLTFEEVAAEVAEVSGRQVRSTPLSTEQHHGRAGRLRAPRTMPPGSGSRLP